MGFMGSISTPRSAIGAGADSINVEVEAKPRRRQFSAEYKLRILREADELAEIGGGVGELLRREGLYSSLLAAWRRERAQGEVRGLAKKRGRKQTVDPGGAKEVRRLTSEVERLRRRLTQAEAIIEVQENCWTPGDPPEEPRHRRARLVTAVSEVGAAVALKPLCEALGVSRASVYRRRRLKIGPRRRRPRPKRALTSAEREVVAELLVSERFVDRSPALIVHTILDEDLYYCSPRMMYRILAERDQLRERRSQRPASADSYWCDRVYLGEAERHPEKGPTRILGRCDSLR